jgi:hypothetical protein
MVLAAGLVFAALMLTLGIVSALLRRLFGRPAAMPRFQDVNRRFNTSRPAAKPAYSQGEVIDIESTPVKE